MLPLEKRIPPEKRIWSTLVLQEKNNRKEERVIKRKIKKRAILQRRP
jgi:hypothetical protein